MGSVLIPPLRSAVVASMRSVVGMLVVGLGFDDGNLWLRTGWGAHLGRLL